MDSQEAQLNSLKRAMETRGRIGMALGIAMVTFDLHADTAWSYLVRQSQHGNIKMTEVAERLIASHDEQVRQHHPVAAAAG